MIVRPRPHWLRLLFVWRGSVLPRILPQLLLVRFDPLLRRCRIRMQRGGDVALIDADVDQHLAEMFRLESQARLAGGAVLIPLQAHAANHLLRRRIAIGLRRERGAERACDR